MEVTLGTLMEEMTVSMGKWGEEGLRAAFDLTHSGIDGGEQVAPFIVSNNLLRAMTLATAFSGICNLDRSPESDESVRVVMSYIAASMFDDESKKNLLSTILHPDIVSSAAALYQRKLDKKMSAKEASEALNDAARRG